MRKAHLRSTLTSTRTSRPWPNALKQISEATESLVAAAATRVVAVDGRDRVNASGFIFAPGIVVTAEEALDRDDDIEITFADGKTASATLVGRDSSTDIAVLRYDAAVAAEAFAIAPTPKAGGLVVAVGRSGKTTTAAFGAIAAVGDSWRSMEGGLIDVFLRIDVALTYAAEGGALVDVDGRLVGMPVFGPRRRVIAIPGATIKRIVDQILAKGSISRGYVGVGVQPVNLETSGEKSARGAVVVSLDKTGPAKSAGILLGDILERWDGEPLGGPRGLVDRLGPDSVGRKVTLGIVRGGKNHRPLLDGSGAAEELSDRRSEPGAGADRDRLLPGRPGPPRPVGRRNRPLPRFPRRRQPGDGRPPRHRPSRRALPRRPSLHRGPSRP